jgi:hypothetical protein
VSVPLLGARRRHLDFLSDNVLRTARGVATQYALSRVKLVYFSPVGGGLDPRNFGGVTRFVATPTVAPPTG